MIPNEKRKTEWWKSGEWVRSLAPVFWRDRLPHPGEVLALTKRLWEAFRGLERRFRRDRGPGERSIALGVPLLLGILSGLWGWPVTWLGNTPEVRETYPAPVLSMPLVSVPVQEAPVGISADSEAVGQELRQVREELESARVAQLEATRSLASLRSQHEAELVQLQEERDRLAMTTVELQAELTAIREAQLRDVASARQERLKAEENIRKLGREVASLQAKLLEEQRKAESAVAAAAEAGRRLQERERRGVEQPPPGRCGAEP